MLTFERHQRILALLTERGSVTVNDLARSLSVVEQTIRRDLSALEERGLLVRSHGGAVLGSGIDEPFGKRLGEAAPEKNRLAAAAAALVNDGESVILDAGTTTLAVARALREKDGLHVITNSVSVVTELVGYSTANVIMLGGQVRESSLSVVGNMAREALQHLHADKLFLGAGGVDPVRGLTNSNIIEADVKRAMMKASREIYVLAHGAKLGQAFLHRFAAVTEVKAILTTEGAPPDVVERIRDLGVEVRII